MMNSFVRAALVALALLAAPIALMAQDDPITTLLGHKSLQENLNDVPYASDVIGTEMDIIRRHGPLEVTLIFTSMGQQAGRALEGQGQVELGARVFNFSSTTQNRIVERLAEMEEEDHRAAEAKKAAEQARANGTAVADPNPLANLG